MDFHFITSFVFLEFADYVTFSVFKSVLSDFQSWLYQMTVLCLILSCKMTVRPNVYMWIFFFNLVVIRVNSWTKYFLLILSSLTVCMYHTLYHFCFTPEVTSQSSLLSSGIPCPGEVNPSSQPTPVSAQSFIYGSYRSPTVAPQSVHLTPSKSPSPSLNSTLSLTSSPDHPPIQHSPWTESSLDQPYEKRKKSRSSSKTR